MLTDDDARRLLHRAGETVTVDPIPPAIDPPDQRRVWPLVAAVAAIAVIAFVTMVVSSRTTSDPEPATPAGDIPVPSVLGYDLEEGADALRDAGFAPRVEVTETCNTSYVVGTEPPAGTPTPRGTEVVVRWAARSMGFCVSDLPLAVDLLAFADGRERVPPIARGIALYDGDGNRSIITAEQATDPAAWQVCAEDGTCISILDRLSEAAHRNYPMGRGGTTRYTSPVLTDRPDRYCTFQPEPQGLGRPEARIGVKLLVDGIFCTQEFVVDVYQDAAGRIDAVALRERMSG